MSHAPATAGQCFLFGPKLSDSENTIHNVHYFLHSLSIPLQVSAASAPARARPVAPARTESRSAAYELGPGRQRPLPPLLLSSGKYGSRYV